MIVAAATTGSVDAPSSGIAVVSLAMNDAVSPSSLPLQPPSRTATTGRNKRTISPGHSSLEHMAQLTIEHDAADDDATATPRRRSIALRLDGKAWLRVEPEALGELGVSTGDEIDDSRRTEVETALARVRARLFIVRSLSVKAQSTAEIEKKLAARDVPAEIAQEAIERVAGYGYLDDAALADQLARGMRSRGYGRRRAEQKLRERGLRGSGAEAALDDAYGEQDEAALAREALGGRSVAEDADRRRALAFLARRGFSATAAWAAIRRAGEED